MCPYIHIVLPTYTVLALIGGFFSLGLMYSRIERNHISFTSFLKMFLISVIGGYLGAKLLFSITRIPWLVMNFSLKNLILLFPQSGLVFYGGLFGVIFSLMFLTRNDNDLRERVFKVAVPAMPLFHAFGRIGCFMTGCCYGKKLPAPLNLGIITVDRIPVQLIESLLEFILFGVIMYLNRKKDKPDLLKYYLIMYAIFRFFIEFFRGDLIRGILLGLSTAQWISLMIICFYIYRGISSKYDFDLLEFVKSHLFNKS